MLLFIAETSEVNRVSGSVSEWFVYPRRLSHMGHYGRGIPPTVRSHKHTVSRPHLTGGGLQYGAVPQRYTVLNIPIDLRVDHLHSISPKTRMRRMSRMSRDAIRCATREQMSKRLPETGLWRLRLDEDFHVFDNRITRILCVLC